MNMIRVTVGNNVNHESVIVNDQTTLRSVLEEQHIDYQNGSCTLDGSTLKPGELDKSFADFGIKEKAFLFCIVKTNNA